MKSNLKRLVPAVQRELRDVEQRREHKQLERQVQQLQKFEAIGRLAGGIAHDFNNVICAILGWAELEYKEAQTGTRLQERLRKICDQAQRAAGLTAQLLAFARRQVLQPRRIDLNKLVEEGTSLLRRVIGEDIEVRLHTYYVRPGSYVLLSVSDTGIGMDAATIDRIFEPFFTTKEIGKGTGLGLATGFGIVKQHGGFINVYSEPGKGTTFRVYLPGDSGAPEPPKAEPDEQPQNGTETILLAEDHESLRELAQETLGALGYHVILASNGIEAVQLFKDNSDRIDLVVMDVVMPGMSGPDAYLKMSAIRPDLGVVFTTGYTAEAASLTSLVEKGASVLQKPYGAKGLSRMIRVVLGRKRTNDSH